MPLVDDMMTARVSSSHAFPSGPATPVQRSTTHSPSDVGAERAAALAEVGPSLPIAQRQRRTRAQRLGHPLEARRDRAP